MAKENTYTEDEQAFKDFFDFSLDGICKSDLEGRILEINPALCDMLGISPKEALSKTLVEFLHPEDVSKAEEGMLRLLEQGEPIRDFELRHFTKCKQLIYLSWNITSKNNVIYAFAKDITKEKSNKKVLKILNSLNMETSDAFLIYKVTKNEDNYATDWVNINPSFEALIGYSFEDLQDLKLSQLYWKSEQDNDNLNSLDNTMKKLFNGEKTNGNFYLYHKDGQKKWFNITKVPVVLEKDELYVVSSKRHYR